jgi:hypothetical protein
MLDVAIVATVNCVLALVVSKKDADFFEERSEGIIINKKVDAGSEEETHDFSKLADTSKTSLSNYLNNDKKNNFMSNQNIMEEIS